MIRNILMASFLILTTLSTAIARDNIKVYPVQQKGKQKVEYYADNPSFAPYQLKIEFPVLKNLKSDKALPFSRLLKTNKNRQYLFSLTPKTKGKASELQLSVSFERGDPNANHNDDSLYLFPFGHGTKMLVGQGYNGSSTHRGQNALDFNMKTGTPVGAARGGIVIAIQQDSTSGGTDSHYENEGNYILIMHIDNTFAIYAHLKHKGSVVNVGDKVKAGSIIGYSGNTGLSSGPHLHFEVYKTAHIDDSQRKISIPTRFLNYDGKAVIPQEGLWYYSTHRGKKTYNVELGRNYKDEHFNNYRDTIPIDDSFKITTKRVDDTILIFAENGFDSPREITFAFSKLVNLKASKSLPLVQSIPPSSKVYLLMLRSNGNKEGREYNMRYKVRR